MNKKEIDEIWKWMNSEVEIKNEGELDDKK